MAASPSSQQGYEVLCDNPACLTDPGNYPPPPDASPAYSGLSYPGGRPVGVSSLPFRRGGFSSASTLSARATVFRPSSAQVGPDGDKLSDRPAVVADDSQRLNTVRAEYFNKYGKKHAAEIKTLLDFTMEECRMSKNLEAAIDEAETKESQLIRRVAEMQKKADDVENAMK